MSLEREHECPRCGGPREFYKSASTVIHLGTKMKWRCSECDFQFVQINGIDTAEA